MIILTEGKNHCKIRKIYIHFFFIIDRDIFSFIFFDIVSIKLFSVKTLLLLFSGYENMLFGYEVCGIKYILYFCILLVDK